MLPRRGRARRGHPRECSHPSVGVRLCPYLWAPRPPASAMRGLPAAAAMAAKGLRRTFGRDLYQDSMIGTDHRLAAEARTRARAARAELSATSRTRIEWVLVAIVARK
jgi:hypothetical protein